MILLTRYDKSGISEQRVSLAQAASDLLTNFAAATYGHVTTGGSGLSRPITVSSLGETVREYGRSYDVVILDRGEFAHLWRLARVIHILDGWRYDPADADSRFEVLTRLPTSRQRTPFLPAKPPATNLEIALYAAAWMCGRREVPEVPGLHEANTDAAAGALGLAVEKELTDGIPFETTILELL